MHFTELNNKISTFVLVKYFLYLGVCPRIQKTPDKSLGFIQS